MRLAFIKKVIELAEKNKDIYILTADTGFKVFEGFREKFPERYLNVGISEAGMIGVAAGLALSNKIVFTYAITPFVTMRCFEQIRNDLCYQKLPVILVGVGQGLTYAAAGATHHSIEDIAIMNCLPNMTIVCPGDPFEVSRAVEESINLDGPCYIRLGKTGETELYKTPLPEFRIGKGISIRRGNDIVIFATGNMLEAAVNTHDILKKKGISSEVISMHTIKPLDVDLITNRAQGCRMFVTIEEHSVIGGLGSSVSNVITDKKLDARLKNFAIEDRYLCTAGEHDYLRRKFGLTPEQLSQSIEKEFSLYEEKR